MKYIPLVLCVVMLSSCVTTSNPDVVDWTAVLEKAELSLEMAHEVYALWDLAHQLLETPEEELAPKREAFLARIAEAEKYLEWVKAMHSAGLLKNAGV